MEFTRFVFFAVGQGSCTLISFPPRAKGQSRRYAIVDCNQSDAASVRDYLESPWFPDEAPLKGPPYALSFVALTHYDCDHFNGVNVLLGGTEGLAGKSPAFHCGFFLYPLIPPRIMLRCYKPKSVFNRQLQEMSLLAFDRHAVRRRSYAFDASYDALVPSKKGRIRIRCIAPTCEAKDRLMCKVLAMASRLDRKPQKENLLSAALQVQFGKAVVTLGGDVVDKEWGRVRAEHEPGRLHELSSRAVLAPHHGGEGNCDDLWAVASRKSPFHLARKAESAEARAVCERRKTKTVAVISCGEGHINHPSLATLQTLKKHNTDVICTSPNAHCIEYFTKEKAEVPCRRNGGPLTARTELALPSGLAYVGEDSLEFPRGIEPAETDNRRAVCLDVYETGEIRQLSTFGDCCAWTQLDIPPS
ncbi:MAG: hypothetical protein IT365_25455 [Candidatus Hydrogenedentes bacterium]|nr:hypothetical protein [Candidatus Hydrogenedentota bacterium]